MKRAYLPAIALLLSACGGNVVEERVDYNNGAVNVCGEGAGLPECRDYNGETYSQELDYLPPEEVTSDDLADKADKAENY